MVILGISAFYHDSAAALISDGDIIAAAQKSDLIAKSIMKAFQPPLKLALLGLTAA